MQITPATILYYQLNIGKYLYYLYYFAPNSPDCFINNILYKTIPVVINNETTFQFNLTICEMSTAEVIWTN